ncbi:MAG: LuxR C-terminal-related transcriptional regulator [Prevotellaceae bacterium]|jgi:regulator of cell morphogenesis and NO signaling|nr:LuxR C-terminal-related transcriptional regulator [Prevotellaceae bacterium]
MIETHTYLPSDKMSDLISDNFSLLMVMSRFGLSLGFGDKSVREVCEAQGVDTRTFLAVANFINSDHYTYTDTEESFSVAALMDYLKRAHTYFLKFNLPGIRRKLIESLDYAGSDELSVLILKFYDEYAREVRRHMEYEDKTVFRYVDGLLQGQLSDSFNIATFAGKHSQIEVKLKELKNIIIKYYPRKEDNDSLNAVLFDIFNCEQDLASHCRVEDELFVPAVSRIERELNERKAPTGHTPGTQREESEIETLSQREKEVIVCVVKGMPNKAIAEHLFISIHTVLTHRRNIARKLQIHSPAGLTIYAIVNHLVRLEEIKKQ